MKVFRMKQLLKHRRANVNNVTVKKFKRMLWKYGHGMQTINSIFKNIGLEKSFTYNETI